MEIYHVFHRRHISYENYDSLVGTYSSFEKARAKIIKMISFNRIHILNEYHNSNLQNVGDVIYPVWVFNNPADPDADKLLGEDVFFITKNIIDADCDK